jgi:aminopeptidase-like protein
MESIEFSQKLNLNNVGEILYHLIKDLYPIGRSLTGHGNRETLNILKQHIPMEVHEVKSGTQVFDWTIPKEWNINAAYIKDSGGNLVVNLQNSNLHVVGYSIPINKTIPFEELKEHLFTLPKNPSWIPYRTSYYQESWGFCLSHNQLLEMKDSVYEVCIDSSLKDGSLTYGEYYIPGQSSDEILISCNICHPCMADENLSAIAVCTILAKHLSSFSLRYSYRFIFTPATIGPIAWLALNEDQVFRIKHGLVLTFLGDSEPFTYKRTRQGNAEIDQILSHLLKKSEKDYQIIDFFPYGYDERQFCSPGFNIAMGSLMRSQHGTFPEYHTSADNLDFVQPDSLAESFDLCCAVLHTLENNKVYLNKFPKCEPQLGKRGLYQGLGSNGNQRDKEMAMLWILNLSDGDHTLLDIANRSGIEFDTIRSVAELLSENDLLKEIGR